MSIEVSTIRVKHNVEMAHRLTMTAGKCENIHGHSWQVVLTVTGEVDERGVLVEYGLLKSLFRDFLDTHFDHHLLLNNRDSLCKIDRVDIVGTQTMTLPGLTVMAGDPTTENFARLIYDWSVLEIVDKIENVYSTKVEVWETATNCATYPPE